MSEEIHQRAEQLKVESMAGEISKRDRHWLDEHLETCSLCAERARAMERAVQSLRSITVRVDPELLRKTHMKVYARAEALRKQNAGRLLLWTSCVLSWAWMAASATYLWRGFNWMATLLGIPNWTWRMGFGLWWGLPLLTIAFALSLQVHEKDEAENLTAALL